MLIKVSRNRLIDSFRIVELSFHAGTDIAQNLGDNKPAWWKNEDFFYTFAVLRSEGEHGKDQFSEVFLEAFDSEENAVNHVHTVAARIHDTVIYDS